MPSSKDQRTREQYLFPTPKEELVWVNAVRDGVTDEWNPVEDYRWLIRVSKEQLLEHIEQDSEDNEGRETQSNRNTGRALRE